MTSTNPSFSEGIILIMKSMVEALLERYMNSGIYEIEKPEVLKLDPFAKMGKPAKIVKHFGGKDPILIDSDYLNYVMQSQYYWIYCQNVRSDAIGQSNVNAEKLKRFIFPLPPLQEQKRIVNKTSCVMSRIEHL